MTMIDRIGRRRARGISAASRLLAVIGLALAALAAPVAACEADGVDVDELTCPICHESHEDAYLDLSLEPSRVAEGEGPGGREMTNSDYIPAKFRVMACPHCGYCNVLRGFNLMRIEDAKDQKDSHATPVDKPAAKEADAPGKKHPAQSQPAKTSKPTRRQYIRLWPAKPLDYPAIRARLKKSVDPRKFRYVNAQIPERFDIMLRTVPGWTPTQRFKFALAAARICDDRGETELGQALRLRAIKAGLAMLKTPPAGDSWRERVTTRHTVAGMQLRVGRRTKSPQLRKAGRAAMGPLLTDLGARRTLALARIKELDKQIEELLARARQRAKKLGWEDWNEPEPDDEEGEGLFGKGGGLFEEDEASRKDKAIDQLLTKIDELRRGKKDKDGKRVPGGPNLKDWPLRSAQAEEAAARELTASIRAELAADALPDLPLSDALTIARKGTILQKEAFLMLHGHLFRQSPVKEFVVGLLGPLYVRPPKERDLFDGPDPAAQRPQFNRYVAAIAHATNRRRDDFIQDDIILTVMPREFTFSPSRPSDRAVAKPKPLKLVPANAELIARALAKIEDDEPESNDMFESEDGASEYIPELCEIDARWMAEILLRDMRRHPQSYLRLRRRPSRSMLQWSLETPSPDEIIARHLPDAARTRARTALKDLDRGKLSPLQATAALLPLLHLRDDESLQILRRAGRSTQPRVRREVIRWLRGRGDPLGMDLLLDSALKSKTLPKGLSGDDIVLLDKGDVPKLRKLHAMAEEQAKAPRPTTRPLTIEEWQFPSDANWYLAALGHLGDKEALRKYNAAAFAVRAKPGDRLDPNHAMTPDQVRPRHTAMTARCANHQTILDFALSYYCTETMAAELLGDLKLRPDWIQCEDRALEVLAVNPATHAHYRKLAANLAPRPTRLATKCTLMRHASKIPVPQVTQAMHRWSRSRLPDLANAAQETLRRLKQTRPPDPRRQPSATAPASGGAPPGKELPATSPTFSRPGSVE